MSSTQTIFLNGRRYDALTGKLLGDIDDRLVLRQSPSLKLQGIKHPHHMKTVDGFIKGVSAKKHSNQQTSHQKLSTAKKLTDHKVAPHANRITERSKTLMRDAVKKPDFTKVKAQQHAAKTHFNRAVVRSMAASAPARSTVVAHAKAIKNSEFAAKINELTTPANPIIPNPQVIQTTVNSEVHLKNLDQLAKIDNGLDLESIFSEASLKLSDSHQPITRKEIRFYDVIADKLRISVKLLFILSVFLFVLIFGGLSSVIFSNNINIYWADSQTGIHAILPTYTPTGYQVQSIKYATGKPTGTVDITFSNKGSGFYSVDEQTTTWDSQALVDKVVIPAVGNSFKTYQIGGRSVYIYEQTAVWVDAGIYYILSNNAHITNNQITQIVNTT